MSAYVPVDEEYIRLLELHAKQKSPEMHTVSHDELAEYLRLNAKYGVFVVDAVTIGPIDPTRSPKMFPIVNTDCRPIPGDTPLACPRAKPKPPPELLPKIEERFRALGLVPSGQTILWVGKQAEMDTLCVWDKCTCFAAESLEVQSSEAFRDIQASAPEAPAAETTAVLDCEPGHEILNLQQIAALMHLQKSSMGIYKRRKDDPLPDPDFPGGGGKRDHWRWSTIYPWIKRNTSLPVPSDFPDIYRRR